MSCTDITAFIGETRDAEGGSIELIEIGADKDRAMITINTAWGEKDSYELINLNETLTYTKNGVTYTVKLVGITYSEFRNEYFCKFTVCYEVTTTGSISCISSPTYAQIFMDDVNTLQYTPHIFSNIQAGNHRIDYYLTNYDPCGVNVTVVAGKTAQAICTLTTVPSTCNQVFLFINNNNDPISGATVSINNKTLTSDSSGSANIDLEIGTTYTAVTTWKTWTLSRTFKACLAPISFFFAPPFLDVGYIRCQAYDSVTNAGLTAFLQIDGISIVPTTPHTTPMISAGPHTVTFIHEGYETKTVTVTVVKGATANAYGSMVVLPEPDLPGFDINVNIPGLLPGQTLILNHVTKIPYTDIWVPDPLSVPADVIRWDNIINKLYSARQSENNCNPAPNIFQGNPLSIGDHYVIEVTSPLDFIYYYVEQDIVQVTDTTTEISIIKQTVPPEWMFKLCSIFDVAESDCIASFYNVIPDILFSAEDLSIIIEGKSIYPPYDAKDPTPWNYAFVALAFIPGSGVVKGVGKAGVKAVKGAKLYPDIVQYFIRNNRWQSAWFPEKQISFLQVMWDLTGAHLDEVVAKLEVGDVDAANTLIKKYLLEKSAPDLCVKDLGSFTKILFDKLPPTMPEKLIKEAGLENVFVMNTGKAIYGKTPLVKETLDTLDDIFTKLPNAKKLITDDAASILKNSDASEEMIHRVVNAADNYPSIVEDIGTKTPLADVDDLIMNAVNKVGYEFTPRLTKTLFKRSLTKTMEAATPIALSIPQTTAIKNIIRTDPIGFSRAMSEFDTLFKIKFIKSLELSGTEGLDALNHAEGIMDVSRYSEIFNTFGYNINDVAHAFTNHFTSMPDYWKSLGISSIDFAADGKTLDSTPPFLARYLADLAESKLTKEVAEELVHRTLMQDSITKIVQKDIISTDEIASLRDLYLKYPIAADNALKQLPPTDLAKFVNILERTDEGKFVSEIFRVREELIAKVGLTAADEMLDFWMIQLRTVVDDASRKSYLKRLSEEVMAYPGKHPAKFIVMLISAVAGPIGLAEFILWRMKETIWDPPVFNLMKAVQLKDKTSALEMLSTFKYLIEKYEPLFTLVSYATPFSVTMMPDYILNTKMTHDLYADILGVPEQKFFINSYLIPESVDGTVSEIVDGDTVMADFAVVGLPEKGAGSAEESTVLLNNSKVITSGGEFQAGVLEIEVRLLGINTPEGKTYDYTCTSLREQFLVRRLLVPGKECIDEETWHVDEAFFNSTKTWIGANLPVNHIATFRSDLNDQFDKYGRLLAVPWVGNISISQKSLAEGQSVVFFYSTNKQVTPETFLASEKKAKDANIGIWPFAAEPPKTGWIKFMSTPTAVEIFLDDELLGNTVSNVLYHETTIGTHTYMFRKVGYTGCQGTIIEINTTHTQSTPFEQECILEKTEIPPPPPPYEDVGALTVKTYSKPGVLLSGVIVYVDNIDRGNAPVTIKNLSPESHSVRLEKTGYLGCSYCYGSGCNPGAGISPCDFSVYIEKDTTKVLEVTMEKVFAIEIASNPDGAIIKVDGKTMTFSLNLIEQILTDLVK